LAEIEKHGKLAEGESVEMDSEYFEEKPCKPVNDGLPIGYVISKREVPDTNWIAFYLDEGIKNEDPKDPTVVTVDLDSKTFSVESGTSDEIKYARGLLEPYGLACDKETLDQERKSDDLETSMNDVAEHAGDLLKT
jgi:hypothetical protein